VVAGEGTSDEMLASDDPMLHQFLHAEAEGPIAFHYPAQAIREQLGLK
jgi:phospholipid/cholesterol/gamma-HCH transport system ATP-binding protein